MTTETEWKAELVHMYTLEYQLENESKKMFYLIQARLNAKSILTNTH